MLVWLWSTCETPRMAHGETTKSGTRTGRGVSADEQAAIAELRLRRSAVAVALRGLADPGRAIGKAIAVGAHVVTVGERAGAPPAAVDSGAEARVAGGSIGACVGVPTRAQHQQERCEESGRDAPMGG